MAVRPTDDRSVGDASAGNRATEQAPSWLYYVAAALAALVVVCAVTLGYLFATRTDGQASTGARVSSLFGGSSDAQQQATSLASDRDAARSVAEQFILRVNTYGPHDLDKQGQMPAYVSSVHAVTSSKLQASFDQTGVVLAEKSVSQSGVGRTATIFSSGVSSLDTDKATVLVAGTISQSYPNPKAPADASKRVHYPPDPVRFSVQLVKIDGQWKVDDFSPVTDGTSDSGSAVTPGSGQPSAQPTGRPSGKPSGGAGTGAGR